MDRKTQKKYEHPLTLQTQKIDIFLYTIILFRIEDSIKIDGNTLIFQILTIGIS
jgi:hypothetical protein